MEWLERTFFLRSLNQHFGCHCHRSIQLRLSVDFDGFCYDLDARVSGRWEGLKEVRLAVCCFLCQFGFLGQLNSLPLPYFLLHIIQKLAYIIISLEKNFKTLAWHFHHQALKNFSLFYFSQPMSLHSPTIGFYLLDPKLKRSYSHLSL